ncbi:hypothetical protein DAEQUDRAFT_807589 [Daedalea quercina L-15889]|uniref:LIM-domain binding protein n=1 Tax=Daedalea quercina L-15889 TaxID=1314783 RepID=A0A165U6E6_9APHY|nr:hypothetical protein DAEQUDRAFT_807589 [Daedalea quercina L-15889]
MNVVPGNDLLRPSVPQLAPSMLNMNPHSFMSQQQHHPQGQPSQGQPQLGMLQNNPNPNSMLPGGQPNNSGMYQLQMQHANSLQRQQVLMQAQAQGLNRPGPQLNGMNTHNPALGGMGFNPNGMMGPQQQQIRRVAAQPNSMNQAGGHMGGMPHGIAGMSMGPNPGQSMAPHMRPPMPQQHLNAMRVQQPPQHMQGHISPDMSMAMSRQPQMPGNNGLPPHVNRATSAQPHMMNNLGQPSGLPQQQHPGGMQGQMHQGGFSAPMGMPHHQPPQLPGASPHTGTHSQNHTPANFAPNMSMGGVPPSQAPANRSQPPGGTAMMMGYQNPSMQPSLPEVPRIPQPNTNSFPFMTSSTSPNPPGDMSQNVGGGQMNGPGPGPHNPHLTTPAQLVDRLNQPANDNFPPPFNLPQTQPNVPARPPSQQHPPHPGLPFPSQQSQLPRQSPRPADPMNQHVAPRPQSQQGQQRQSPPGPSRTPRGSQPPLPNQMIPPRIPMPPTGPNPPGPPHQPPHSQPQGQGAPGAPAQTHPVQIAPRQQPGPPSQPTAPPNVPGPAHSQPDGAQHPPQQQPQPAGPPPQNAQPIVRPPFMYLLGSGQAIARLVCMSGDLAMHGPSREMPFWDRFVRKYFTPKATMKITLWKDNQRQEAKPFEIGTPILPRFFQVTTQSGVKSMSLSLDGARERASSSTQAIVECPDALWTFRYQNGFSVVLKGPFTAHVVLVAEPPPQTQPPQVPTPPNYALRIENMIFDALTHEKLINIDSIEGTRMASSPSAAMSFGDVDPRLEEPRTIIERAVYPAEPINAFGIPQATMRCLELAESVTQMGDLIQFSATQQLGPRQALARYALQLRQQMRQQQGEGGADIKANQPGRPGAPAVPNGLDGVHGGVAPTPPASMYPGTPSLSSAQPGQAPPTPQNPPHAEPAKQGKGSQSSTANQASGQNMPSTPASASTPAAGQTPGQTTPAMPNATLKRKAGQRAEPDSPALANNTADAPPPGKRGTRKRPRTGTQGGG